MVSNKTLIKKNNSKKSTESAKRCDSKQFCALQNVLENAFFSSKIYLKEIFYIVQGFLY